MQMSATQQNWGQYRHSETHLRGNFVIWNHPRFPDEDRPRDDRRYGEITILISEAILRAVELANYENTHTDLSKWLYWAWLQIGWESADLLWWGPHGILVLKLLIWKKTWEKLRRLFKKLTNNVVYFIILISNFSFNKL